MKSYVLSEDEVGKLKALVGKKISSSGYCSSQDENGVASQVSMPSVKGILKEIIFDEKTGVPKSIHVDDPEFGENGLTISIDFSDGNWTWDLHRSIYHEGEEVIDISLK